MLKHFTLVASLAFLSAQALAEIVPYVPDWRGTFTTVSGNPQVVKIQSWSSDFLVSFSISYGNSGSVPVKLIASPTPYGSGVRFLGSTSISVMYGNLHCNYPVIVDVREDSDSHKVWLTYASPDQIFNAAPYGRCPQSSTSEVIVPDPYIRQ